MTGMDKNSCSLGKLFLLVLANQTPQPHNTTTINISVQHSLIDNIESFGSLLVVGDPECKEISDCFLPQTPGGVQSHWCQVDKAVNEKIEAGRVEKLAQQAKDRAEGKKVDGRKTRPAKLPVALGGNEPIFRKKDANFDDYTCGIFQESSILVTRNAHIEALKCERVEYGQLPLPDGDPGDGRSLLHDISLMPYKIKTIDPGHTNIICSSVLDRSTGKWTKGRQPDEALLLPLTWH